MIDRCLATLALLLFSFSLSAEIRLPQADGGELTLASPAKRIITLAPHLTELAFEVGAGSQIVATVEYSEFPAAAVTIPRVGDAFRLDLEQILMLKPDLVIAWHSGNPKPAVARLQSLGIPTWTIEIRTPEQIAIALEQMGMATGQSERGIAAAKHSRQVLERLTREYSGLMPVSYFFQIAAKPLYTINGEHLISQGLELCAAVNVFRDEPGLAPQISHESVIAADPEVLIASAASFDNDPLALWREWPGMQAIEHDAIILLPADEISRASPRFLDAIERACNLVNQYRNRNSHE